MQILIVEDHPFVRELLCKLCADLGDEVVYDTGSGKKAIEAIERIRPALLLVDLRLPDISGFDVISSARLLRHVPRILVISAYNNVYTTVRMRRSQVNGFIDKATATLQVFRSAIAAVAQGGRYFSESFQQMTLVAAADSRRFDKILSDKECSVLELVGDGRTDREIAHKLNISDRTVESHRSNIKRKLGFRTKSELENFAWENGFSQGLVPPW